MSIKELDFVVLRKDSNWKIAQVIRNKVICMCKMKFCLNGVVGQHYGSSFKVEDGQVVKLNPTDLLDDDAEYETETCEKDNRHLLDNCDNQKMSKDEIHMLRKQGITGDEIVEQLVENSATFCKKTEFSQQKYLKKKRQKHIAVITVLRPNTRNLIELYYSRGPTKICNLRMDSLAQILVQANVHAGCKALVIESCSGLIVGSFLERMAGFGCVIHLYTGTAPNRPAVEDGYKFSNEHLKCLHSFPLNEVNTLVRKSSTVLHENSIEVGLEGKEERIASVPIIELPDDSLMSKDPVDVCMDGDSAHCNPVLSNEQRASLECDEPGDADGAEVPQPDQLQGEERRQENSGSRWTMKRKLEDTEEREQRRAMRRQQIQRAKSIIEAGNMDCLVFAAKFHPTPVVLDLIEFVSPSRPIVVFCPYKEPLLDCFLKLKEKANVLMLKLSETWLREYQILPNRTHPSIAMSGSGGYLLTAITKLEQST